MARQNFNDGQEIIYQDLNKISSKHEREMYDRILFEMLQRVEDSFFGAGFNTSFSTSTQVNVAAGVGFQTDGTVGSEEPTKRLLYNSAIASVNLSTPDVVNDRIDLIVVKAARVVSDVESRKYKASPSGVISNQNLDIETDWEAEIIKVDGTPGVTPAAPAVPSGYLAIAECYVTAVTGLSGSGAITDLRNLLPVGGEITIDSSAFVRTTAGANTSLSLLLSELDNFVKFGEPNYSDYEDIVSDPAAPAAGKKRLYFKGNVAYFKNEGGSVTPLGSGSGGGGGAQWFVGGGNAPTESDENGEKVYLYESGLVQSLSIFIKIPESYLTGRQIFLNVAAYSPSASNTFLLNSVATLVRKNNDAITAVANQYTSTNTALTNTLANQYRNIEIDLTNAVGQINGFAVSPGDLLKVTLKRDSDTDTDDVRFVPSSTEFRFG